MPNTQRYKNIWFDKAAIIWSVAEFKSGLQDGPGLFVIFVKFMHVCRGYGVSKWKIFRLWDRWDIVIGFYVWDRQQRNMKEQLVQRLWTLHTPMFISDDEPNTIFASLVYLELVNVSRNSVIVDATPIKNEFFFLFSYRQINSAHKDQRKNIKDHELFIKFLTK